MSIAPCKLRNKGERAGVNVSDVLDEIGLPPEVEQKEKPLPAALRIWLRGLFRIVVTLGVFALGSFVWRHWVDIRYWVLGILIGFVCPLLAGFDDEYGDF
jgi:hypothetical protein